MLLKRSINALRPVMFVCLICVFALCLGCNDKQKAIVSPIPCWTNIFHLYSNSIVTGKWDEAEDRWMDLKLGATNLTVPEQQMWIAFQVQILECTQNDPLKDQVRIMAVQEIGDYPKCGVIYLQWLKNGLSTNLFRENAVRTKAHKR